MIQYLRATDVFVAPFKSVLTSGSVILAMSYGLPCIVPRLGCLPETLSHQEELIYKANDVSDLYSKLNHVVNNQSRVSEWGDQNRRTAESDLDWNRIGKATANAYNR